MKQKTLAWVAALLILIYLLLTGVAAYKQYYTNAVVFKQMEVASENGEEISALMADYKSSGKLSTNLNRIAMGYATVVTIAFGVLLLMKRLSVKQTVIAVVVMIVLGALSAVPWALMEGVSPLNYYMEQQVTAIIVFFVTAALCLVATYQKRKS